MADILDQRITHILTQKWWAVALRGLLALVFGVLVFFWPGISLMALVILFGAYVLTDGIFTIVTAIGKAAERQKPWWPMLLEGIVGIVGGVLTFYWPGITALVLLWLIGAWAIITDAFEIFQAIQLRKEIEGEWLLLLGGIAPVVFGVLVGIFPGAGALAIVWLIGSYSMAFGILLLVLAFRLQRRQVRQSLRMSAKPT
jgi:uncharacterized membrane protein HdeD (DUF308 family)